MKPIGLTFKDIKTNPFTGITSGELMVVHHCLSCGKISGNRVAGDDNSYSITRLLEDMTSLNGKIINGLSQWGMCLLTREDRQAVLTTLYGYNYQEYIK